ncbi:MAG TPA: putative metal-binding motif-containing protein, partial [Malonomonas sp.]
MITKILIAGLLLCLLPASLYAGICSVVDAGTYIEAEHYNNSGNNFGTMSSATGGYSGSGYLPATSNDTNFPPSGTPLEYLLYFPTAGSYYLHVKGNSNDSNSDDSIWYGISGSPVGGIDFPRDNNWNWSNVRLSEGPNPPAINIPASGLYAVNFWAREDGFKFDAFTMSTAAAFPGGGTSIDPRDPLGVCTTPAGVADHDFDGDGFTEQSLPTADCNDSDPSIFPGQTELCGNAEDDNCDGQVDENCSTVVISDGGLIAQVPLTLVNPAKPQIMLNMSNDHQLFMAAYSDYDDYDGDQVPDKTYIHAVKYFGYFDPDKCYDYDTLDDRFEPASLTNDRYCSGNWSGNFLNWATMARIDTVRKILYGGYRSTDTPTLTVLERSYIPNDMHSWVKFYNGSDLPKLTPFNKPVTERTASSAATVTIS